ncbi:MAG: 2-phospho-L-lactate transferase [Thermomicrobiales bacterium]|jgi:LPPG:FO 2-phospho-L-lactate transferase|nr:2-phospho-L-lactate transferase [Thermomicrobiales bacterium]
MIVALAGGVGGAKMAHGLAMASDPAALTVIVNTADDFDHLGLRICPDIDTVLYTLGGIANPATGWGIAGDTRIVLDTLRDLGGDDWFMIGDRDFATHILRTQALSQGSTLAEITARLATALGIVPTILPMSNQPVATIIETPDGPLDFQAYFVGRQQRDEVVGVRFQGAEGAVAQPDAIAAIRTAETVVINPSNPIVSIGPILAVDGYRQALESTAAVRVAVSPIVGGKALKGPADRMLASLGHESSALGVARIYDGLIDGLVIDTADAALADAIQDLGIATLITNSVMQANDDRARLGGEVLDFAANLRSNGVGRR